MTTTPSRRRFVKMIVTAAAASPASRALAQPAGTKIPPRADAIQSPTSLRHARP